jgi:hypothetical protein
LRALEDIYYSSVREVRSAAIAYRASICPNLLSPRALRGYGVALEMIARLRARDCFAHPELTPLSAGGSDEYGRLCRIAAGRVPELNYHDILATRERLSRISGRLQRQAWTVDQVTEDLRSVCASRIGPDVEDSQKNGLERLLAFYDLAQAALTSPTLNRRGLVLSEPRAALIATWSEGWQAMVQLRRVGVLYGTESYFDFVDSIEDMTRTMQSLAQGRIPIGIRLRMYLEGQMDGSDEERRKIEAALDQLRDQLRELANRGALVL